MLMSPAMRRLAPCLAAGLAWLALAGWVAADAPPSDPPPLQVDRVVESELEPGTVHRYRIDPRAGDAWVTFTYRGATPQMELRGMPQPVRVEGPANRWWLRVPEGSPEPLELEIRSVDDDLTTSYRLFLETVPPEIAGGPSGDAARNAGRAGEIYATEADAEGRRRALALYREAVHGWQAAGRHEDFAWTWQTLAEIHRGLGDSTDAAEAYRHALGGWRDLGRESGIADALDGLGLLALASGDLDEAGSSFERALEHRRRVDDPAGLGVTQNNLCSVLHARGRLAEAAPCYEDVVESFRRARRSKLQALVLNNLGAVHESLGEPHRARERYTEALALLDEDEGRSRARVLANLGVVHRSLGELGDALVYYGRALEVLRELGDRPWEARILSNLGTCYFALGDRERARVHLERSLELRRELGDRRGEAYTLYNLGLVLSRDDEIDTALDHHRRALELRRKLGDRRGEAAALSILGDTYLRANRPETAQPLLHDAVALARELEAREILARSLQRLGQAQLLLGRLDDARRRLGEALGIDRQLSRRAGEALDLRWLSEVELEAGRPALGLEYAEAAIEAVEDLRQAVPHTELRAALLASYRRVFELALEHRMTLHRRQPEDGHALAALALSERARARSLLDLLLEAGTDLHHGVDEALARRERELSQRLHARLEHRVTLAGSPDRREDLEALDRELETILEELDRVEVDIRRRSPRYAALTHPEPLDAGEIRTLLGDDTLLLEYALGEERSFLWAVSETSVEVFELPPRKILEEAARDAHGELSVFDPMAGGVRDRTLARFSELVLAPVASRLDGRRLVIVADGALHYVPFAGLPEPAGAPGGIGQPLIVRHEIVHLPSASTLALLRRERRRRSPAPRLLAVLADPVFRSDDPRLLGEGAQPVEARLDPLRGEAFVRLPATRREAAALAELVPPDRLWTALGFDAGRQAVLSGDLGDYRWVHFATHGVIDASHPELSGLLLSRYDEEGRPLEGFLSLNDIYGLELAADLVVLSGCETALGPTLYGEGLVGLTRGFLHAGASRVLASLWRVQDRATAELMARLYRGLLAEGLPPGAALRSAQLEIRRQRRWRDPYFWAPFVLQGDWSAP